MADFSQIFERMSSEVVFGLTEEKQDQIANYIFFNYTQDQINEELIKNILSEEYGIIDEAAVMNILNRLGSKMKQGVQAVGDFIQQQLKRFKEIWGNAQVRVQNILKQPFFEYTKGKVFGFVDPVSLRPIVVGRRLKPGQYAIGYRDPNKINQLRRSAPKMEEKFFGDLFTQLLFEQEEDEDEELAQAMGGVRKSVGASRGETPKVGQKGYIDQSTPRVTIKYLQRMVSKFMNMALVRKDAKGSSIPKLLIMGPPGAGKTQIVNQFEGVPAPNGGKWKINTIEVDKVFPESLAGFPVESEENIYEYDKKGEIKRDSNGAPILSAKGKKIVMTATDILPPSGDPNPWLIFFDEINRDADKIGSVMNLIDQGRIGGSYTVPKRTIMVAAANVGDGQIDNEKVGEMYGTFFTRLQGTYLLDYDWKARIVYGSKEGDKYTTFNEKGKEIAFDMGSRDVPILSNWLYKKMQEQGNSFKIVLKQINPDHPDYVVNPRLITNISAFMKRSALEDYTSGELVSGSPHDKEYYEENWEKEGYPSAPRMYLEDNQEYYLIEAGRQNFGGDPGPIVQEITGKFKETQREVRALDADSILLKYIWLTEEDKKAIDTEGEKSGTNLKQNIKMDFVQRLSTLLSKYKTGSEFLAAVKKKDASIDLDQYHDEDDAEVTAANGQILAAKNISKFLADNKTSKDIVKGIVDEMQSIDEKKNPFAAQVYAQLLNHSKGFASALLEIAGQKGKLVEKEDPTALKLFRYLSDNELLLDKPKFKKLVKSGPDSIEVADLPTRDLNDSNYRGIKKDELQNAVVEIHNYSAMLPWMKSLRKSDNAGGEEQTESIVERGMRSLFESM